MTLKTKRNIVVIGMGYVGIPAAALLADVPGHKVIGVQRRSTRSGWKIDWINAGKNPFEGDEPGMDELMARVVLEKKSFHVTDDYAVCQNADVILIDVQTPTDTNRIPQYVSLREVSAQAGKYLRPGVLVVIESTVAPGTTQNIVQPILEKESGLKAGSDFFLAFSYERVMPGKLLEYITNFPRVVGGINEESTRRAVDLYRTIVRKEITATSVLAAELAKTMENAYRDVNIAFSNEMARVCEAMGVDVYEIRRLMNARPDRNMHLPGAGVGGHCPLHRAFRRWPKTSSRSLESKYRCSPLPSRWPSATRPTSWRSCARVWMASSSSTAATAAPSCRRYGKACPSRSSSCSS